MPQNDDETAPAADGSEESVPLWLRGWAATGSGVLGAAGTVAGFVVPPAVLILAAVLLDGAGVAVPWQALGPVVIGLAMVGAAGGFVGAGRLSRRLHARRQRMLDEIPARPRLTGGVGGGGGLSAGIGTSDDPGVR